MSSKKNKKKAKKILRKKKFKKDHKNLSILPVLLIIALLSLFSETVRTIPVGALSEKLNNISYELPELNSSLIEKKLLKKDYYENVNENIILQREINKQKKNSC